MRSKWLDVFYALLLGLVLPTVLFTLVARQQEKIPASQPKETTAETTVPEKGFQLTVLMEDGTVEEMELDRYITAVVLREMPAEFETEALKAQAVVARTYALRRYATGGKHVQAAVCTDPSCCQGYCAEESYVSDGGSAQMVDKVKEAVSATSGEVLLYNGELIEATYFSCSGGRTEDASAVWGADIPYLRAVESPGEENASHYTDTVTFTVSEFTQLLDLPDTASDRAWVEDIRYTEGGGIDTVTIQGKTFEGTQLRQLLGLRSTAFAMTVIGNTVTVTTKGYGHRVGMSQYGADAMAVQGSSYSEILQHYYQGVSLEVYDARN